MGYSSLEGRFTGEGVVSKIRPSPYVQATFPICPSDIINYGNLHNIDFIRTQTLCQGSEKCDFCFVRHRKGEAWERSKSI